ncbi:hypothetical protein PoB_000667500 [Plakobranchus ocellatus]|uniref:Wiskott-Aldrich syndrome protein family member n=1 Tax=Plakobranchus ocellatus TaxID=259542 RepID=A0AAV3YCD4_9GAST|nr:hypothetical protein PoB_000667500 [Plakobranchus ocellatus]
MKEESYVLIHSHSSLTQSVDEGRRTSVVHPALRTLQGRNLPQRIDVQHPPILRSNSAPSVDSSPDQSSWEKHRIVLGCRRMNSNSGGDKGSLEANYSHHHVANQKHNHHRNNNAFDRSQPSRFAYPGFSTAGFTYNTYWTPNNGTETCSMREFRPSVHIPALDLTAITLDDGEDDKNNGKIKAPKECECKDTAQLNNGLNGDKKLTMADEKPGNKKQKASFVFPYEKSLADFDGVRKAPSHLVYEDPASTSPYAQGIRSFCADEMSPTGNDKQEQSQQLSKSQQMPHAQPHKTSKLQEPPQTRTDSKDQKVIHFSLANTKIERYMVDDEPAPSPSILSSNDMKEPQRTRESMVEDIKARESEAHDSNPIVNEGFGRRASDSHHNVQEILDVVVVDGHLNTGLEEKEVRGEDSDTVLQDLKLEDVVPEPSKEKPKPRVTFSFENEVQSSRSLKRYTPVKMDIKPLQGVLKKRPEPTQVMDTDHSQRFEASKQTFFKDSNAVFRTNSKTEGIDQSGIRVKHLHTTNFDLTKEAGKRGVAIPSTMLKTEKPPIPVSRRVALAAAENAALGITSNCNNSTNTNRGNNNNSNLLFTGGLTYICSNANGRVAYFRPADVGSRTSDTTSNPNIKIKSRSTEDINGADSCVNFYSGKPNYNNQSRPGANRKTGNRATSISSPYMLRRSVSTEHTFAVSRPRGGGNGGVEAGGVKTVKPRVAFGSFIVPKETTPRVKKAQIKYQEVETGPRASIGNSGTYIHSHTRRTSPYSAPTQVLYDRSATAGGSAGFRRPYTAQLAKASRMQQAPGLRTYTKDNQSHQQLAQRHSAPSTFNSSKSRMWRTTAAKPRISIDSSPSQADSGAQDQLNRSNFPEDIAQCTNTTVGTANIAASNGNFLLPNKLHHLPVTDNRQLMPNGKQGTGTGAMQTSQGKSTSGTERLASRTLSRPDLSALNMLANRDKGVSQTRFLASLSKAKNID